MCLLCPFPIVKAISVRLQYFKDETKQSICLGNQKSTWSVPSLGSRASAAPAPWICPSPSPPPLPLCPCPAPHGACLCLCACVCDGEPPCTPTVCLSEYVFYPRQDGHSLETWGPGAEKGRAQSRSPRPPHTLCVRPTGHRSRSQVFKKVSPLTGTH